MAENLHINEALQKEPVAVLTRYLEGGLSVEEIEQLEELMAEDPFMADALEGLRVMPEPGRVQAIGQELRFKAHKLLRAKRPIVSLYQFNQYATAAVAVLLVLFVASAAIILTSRIQDADETQAITESLPGNQAIPDQPLQEEKLTPFVPAEPAQPTENEKMWADAQQPKSQTPTPTAAAKERQDKRPTVARPKEEKKLAEDIIVADNASTAEEEERVPSPPASVIVESITEIPADQTLSEEELNRFKEAFTEAEDAAYQKALQAFNQSLVVVVQRQERTQNTAMEVQVFSELEKKNKARKRDNNRNANSKKESPVTAGSTTAAREEEDRDSFDDVETSEKDMDVSSSHEGEEKLLQTLYAQPTSSEAWLDLGKYYVEEGKNFKAERYLRVAARSPVQAIRQEATELLNKVQNSKN